MADAARNNVYTVLARFEVDLIEHVGTLINEIVDVDLLQQIRVLLENNINALDADVLLHPPNPAANPADPAADQAPEEMVIDDEVVNARKEVDDVLNRFQFNLVNYVNNLVDEMVDVVRLQEIQELLETIINALDANVLLHPDAPAANPPANPPANPAANPPANPEANPPANPAANPLANPAADQAPEEIVIDDDVAQGSSDED